MRLEVLASQWATDGAVYTGGVHDDVKLTRKLAPLVAAAEAAGTVVVEASAAERKLLRGHVQSQADGEKAYDAAQKSGRWRHGQLVTRVAELEDRLADEEQPLDKAGRALALHQLDQAKTELADTEEPT